MNIHEYQAKEILRKYGIPVGDFIVINSHDALKRAISAWPHEHGVLKVQVHAGGRGKAGGVKVAHSQQEILEHGQNLLGMKLINQQTGPEGVICRQLILAPLVDIAKEYYLAATIDRKRACAVLIASPEGGMDIEEIAAKDASKILTLPITADGKVRSYNLLRLIKFMGWKEDIAKQGKQLAQALAKAFVETDASLIEINPLVATIQGELIALDAKFSIDDNALFRHSDIAAYYDSTQLPPEEAEAQEFELAYISLDGNIGCMVNGAGLAMATMDIIKVYGGKPANFLDVGGGASQEKVAAGFQLLLSDKKVKAILVNIFGGIMNCETLANGIISAAAHQNINVPLVVRMEGTHVEQGKKLLADSGISVILADDLTDAAKKIVNAIQ